jgi:murein L,D-transpeptidase YafK
MNVFQLSNAGRSFKRCILAVLCSFLFLQSTAQTTPNQKDLLPKRNYKVLEEHKDKEDNTVRTIQYYQGQSRIVETQTIRSSLREPIDPDTLNKDSVIIVVFKSRFVLEVFYRRRMIRAYKAVFGPKPQENKKMEGDRCTPEGSFTIQSKNPKSKYNKFMLLNYPNDSCIAVFNRLKDNGLVPRAARIGGDIGIHGIWKGGDDMIDKKHCWTDGCVAIKNKDVDELYNFVGVGTRVIIRK